MSRKNLEYFSSCHDSVEKAISYGVLVLALVPSRYFKYAGFDQHIEEMEFNDYA